MKKTLTTALLFTALAITAQTPDMKLAGKQLQKATTHYYVGSVITMAGAGIMFMGANQKDKNIQTAGIVFALVGTIVVFESHTHIGKAGVILQAGAGSIGIKF